MKPYIICALVALVETACLFLFLFFKEKLIFQKRTSIEDKENGDEEKESHEIDSCEEKSGAKAQKKAEADEDAHERGKDNESEEASDRGDACSLTGEKKEENNVKGDGDEDISPEKSARKKAGAFSTAQSILILLCSLAVFCAVSFFLQEHTADRFGYAKLSAVGFVTVTAAFTDLKKKIIPNALILFGFAFRLLLYILELIFCSEQFLDIFKNDMLGFAIGFGILFVACIVSKKAIGFGDVKLFGVIGICTGAICTYTTLLFGLIINTVISLAAMIIKKKNKKDSIPFAPAICIGYLAAIFISSF